MHPVHVLDNWIIFEAPPQVAAMFPNSRYSAPVCAVEYRFDHVLLLRNLGYDAPSPIRDQYHWPIRRGRTPRWYQKTTAEFMTTNKRAFCLNAMRTGKTNAVLWAADYLKNQGYIRKCVIASPLSTLERVWGDSIFIDFSHRKFEVLHGSAQKRRDLLNAEADFYIINHDGIEVVQKQMQDREDLDLIIFDEVAGFRNSDTDKWRAAKSIIKPHAWGWGLTGTPTPNAPTDAYGQMKLLRPENFKGSFTKCKQATMIQVGPFRWVPRNGAENVVQQLMYPSIRYARSVNTDMEPTIIEREAPLSKEQTLHYNKLLKESVTIVNGTQITAVNAAILASKLIQASCGVMYGSNGEIAEVDFGPRLHVLEELIEENDEKVLVFVPFTGVLDALARELRKRWTVAIVDGGVSPGKRNKIFSDFQNMKDPHVILAHPGTMAHGLDLTAASLIVWYAPHRKNEEHEQANARIDGSAQKVKIDIAYIGATPTDWGAYRVLQGKTTWQQMVLDLVNSVKK